MTVEAWTRAPVYTVSGIGPYRIPHPYAAVSIRVSVVVAGQRQLLAGADFTTTPESSTTEGDVYLSPAAAATHAGRSLIIDRLTPDEQGWLATQGEREAALAAQLDRMTQSIQEIRGEVAGAIRIRDLLEPFDWTDGTVPMRDGTRVVSGPTLTQVLDAAANAVAAANSATAAAASAAEALAKENSMLRARDPWATATAYAPSDIVRQGTVLYRCLVAHTSGVFATDLAALRWQLWLQDGAAGAGTGDMLKSDNFLGLTDVPLARTRLALQALAIKSTAAFADIDPAAVITDVETLAANKVANAFPVAKAVTDYVDALLWTKRSFVATTSGNVFDEAAIPAWVNRMRLIIENMSLSGTEDILIQLGTAGGIVAAGYSGSSSYFLTNGAGRLFTTGLGINISSASRRMTGVIEWERPDPTANRWIAACNLDVSDGAKLLAGTRISLPGALTQLRVTRTGTIPGSQAFDNGGFRLDYAA